MAQQLPTQSQFGDYSDWPGRAVLDSSGQRLGGVREIYLDRETGRPEWVLVDVDDAEARFVPLADAEVDGWSIRVAHASETIRDAPGIGTEPRIDQSEERRLYTHYGLEDMAQGGDETPDDSGPSWQARGGEPSTDTSRSDDSAAAFLTNDGSDSPAPFSGTDESTSSETEALIDAPPPAEPPSPAEIEAAQIPDEPPAASERAAEYETAPFGAVAPPEDDDPTPAPAVEPPTGALLTPPADEPPVLTPAEEPPMLTPPVDEPPSASLADVPAPPPPPVTMDTREADDSPPTAPEFDASSLTPHAAPPETPSWTSNAAPPPPPLPEEPERHGALEAVTRSPGRIALAAAAAAVLFFIVRKLR